MGSPCPPHAAPSAPQNHASSRRAADSLIPRHNACAHDAHASHRSIVSTASTPSHTRHGVTWSVAAGSALGAPASFLRIGKYGASFAFSAAEGFLFDGVDARGSRGEERLELRLGERAVVLVASVAVVGAALVAADGDGVFAHAAEVRRAVPAVHLLG